MLCRRPSAAQCQHSQTRACVRARAQVPLRMGVHHISFSAHADFEQTSGFLDAVKPPHVVLVHGEYNEMRKLQRVRGAPARLPACG